MTSPSHPHGQRLGHSLLSLAVIAALLAAGPALAKPDKAEMREIKREMNGDPLGGKPRKSEERAEARPARTNLTEAESRGLEKLREFMEVTDDAEWEIIAARVIKVGETRAAVWTASPALRNNPTAGGDKRSAAAHPEQDALRSALKDRLPDAEIKARQARAHEIYQENQAKLARAQDELRAVLTVRQEAIAVMAGLLPP